MRNSIGRKQRIAALLCLFCSIPVIASAGVKAPTAAERTAKVSFADLNLSDEQEVAVLFRRLQRASRQVCGSRTINSARSLKQRQLNRQCYSGAMADAVQEIGNAELTKLHAGF